MALERWRERAAELEQEVYALSLAFRDPQTPMHAKGVIALTLAYAASPVDLIPDFLPVVGYLDELVVLPAGVALALRLTPDAVVDDCRTRVDEDVDVGRIRWAVGVVVVLLWVAAAVFLYHAFVGPGVGYVVS